ncbi:MAG: hypothetical protein F6K41_16930 [Symploca sp. SIO3E6]|nr:hypothetical protein [Caldora sp. SIO3E6]
MKCGAYYRLFQVAIAYLRLLSYRLLRMIHLRLWDDPVIFDLLLNQTETRHQVEKNQELFDSWVEEAKQAGN